MKTNLHTESAQLLTVMEWVLNLMVEQEKWPEILDQIQEVLEILLSPTASYC
jgi:hypothetical protein